MWIAQTEEAKCWMSVLTDLKNRGVQDIFIACVDGLTGFPDAIAATFPQTLVQLCMVHLVRNSVAFVSDKHRKEVCADLKAIYTAATEDEAELHLELFADSSFSSGGKPSYRNDSEKWDRQYPTISRIWKSHWVNIIPTFNFPSEIGKVMDTTNAIESLNMTLRKVRKKHRVFPNDEAVLKVLYLAIGNLSKKWTMPVKDWKPALNRFAIEFGGRLPKDICP